MLKIEEVQVYDLRKEQVSPHPKSRIVLGRTMQRPPRNVTGIVVHQTAVEYGLTAGQLRASNGDRMLATARRGLPVGAHAVAFNEGIVSWINDLPAYMYHANLLNSRSLGLEIEGLYSGLENDPDHKTVWQGGTPSILSDLAIAASCRALKLLVEEGRKLGMPIKYIWAHRQSSEDRRSDPGEEIWKKVVLGYAVPVLGLVTDPSLIVGDGRPVPKAWQEKGGVGEY